MSAMKILALSAMGLIWLAGVVFVAWLYPKDESSNRFRDRS